MALTGWDQRDYRRRSQEAGFDRYLVKPVEPHSLKQMLTNPREAGLDEHSLAAGVIKGSHPS